MKNLYVLLLLCVFTFDVNAEENINQSENEISIGISVSSSGSMGEVSGLHTAIYGNPGYNVKKVRLTDDTLRTEDYAISLDYYRKIKDDWYLNAGISHSHKKGNPKSGTFVVGGYVVDPAPPFTIKGITLNLGPSYRFKLKSNLTPYVGLNATYFNGKITDTNYPQFEVEGMLFGNPNHSECELHLNKSLNKRHISHGFVIPRKIFDNYLFKKEIYLNFAIFNTI